MNSNPTIDHPTSNNTKQSKRKCQYCGHTLAKSKSPKQREPSFQELEQMQRAALMNLPKEDGSCGVYAEDEELLAYLGTLMTRRAAVPYQGPVNQQAKI